MMQQLIVFLALVIAAIAAALIIIKNVYRYIRLKHSVILDRLDNVERLLLDIRDGAKNFYKEKRESLRFSKHMLAKLSGDSKEKFSDILNISYGGALLRTRRNLKIGDIMEMSIFLSLYPEPINVKLKVVNIRSDSTLGKNEASLEVGVKFLS
ncbi:MAG: PilZ domain-containing protein, partial [Candidatus Omnitrophica bacterium]|nr:PilZ domain-containing protein [Candidatus Omnitrophota bacterium]